MISYVFEIKEHKEYGTMGLKMVGRSWMEPLPGMAVAHDVLEHFPNDDGTPEQELMALGASIYVRDFGTYFGIKGQRETDPGANIAADMPAQQGYMQSNGQTHWADPGRSTRLDEYEDYITSAIKHIQRLMAGEFESSDILPAFKEPAELKKLAGWLRKGFRRAQRRYRDVPSCYTVGLFMEIEKEADNFIRHHDYEGQQIRISVSLKNRRVIATPLSDDGGY